MFGKKHFDTVQANVETFSDINKTDRRILFQALKQALPFFIKALGRENGTTEFKLSLKEAGAEFPNAFWDQLIENATATERAIAYTLGLPAVVDLEWRQTKLRHEFLAQEGYNLPLDHRVTDTIGYTVSEYLIRHKLQSFLRSLSAR